MDASIPRHRRTSSDATSQRTSTVSLTELSEALNDTVSELANPPPPQLAPLLWGLKEKQLDLQNFCRAVRITLGAGVLSRMVERVGMKKASKRFRELWQRALGFARIGAVFIALHARCKAPASPVMRLISPPGIRSLVSDQRLPPSKRMSLREVRLRRSDVADLAENSGSSLAENSGMMNNKRGRGLASDALALPPQTKRTSFASSRHSLAEWRTGVETSGIDALAAVASMAVEVPV